MLMASWCRCKGAQHDACKVFSVCVCVCLGIIKRKTARRPWGLHHLFIWFFELVHCHVAQRFSYFSFFRCLYHFRCVFFFQVGDSENLMHAGMYEIIHPFPWCDVISCHIYFFLILSVSMQLVLVFFYFLFFSKKWYRLKMLHRLTSFFPIFKFHLT